MATSITRNNLTGVFRSILNDHNEAVQLCDRLASADTPEERTRLLATASKSIGALTHAEDKVIFNQLGCREANSEAVALLVKEHDEIGSSLARLASMDVDSKDWLNEVQTLTELVEMHSIGTLDFLREVQLKQPPDNDHGGFEINYYLHRSEYSGGASV